VDPDGRVLAAHRGAHHFTVGQRRGLGIGAAEPLYVLATDTATNRVVAGPRAMLATRSVSLRGARLHRPAAEVDRVKLRYRSRAVPCRVTGDADGGRLELELLQPVDGAAPGQTACLLRGDVVVGRGTIAHRT
jgi:tRNA-uridine 2-sulfurtransferase